jgi:hypothetical protein
MVLKKWKALMVALQGSVYQLAGYGQGNPVDVSLLGGCPRIGSLAH